MLSPEVRDEAEEAKEELKGKRRKVKRKLRDNEVVIHRGNKQLFYGNLLTFLKAATHSLYNARLSEVKRAGDLRGQARLCGGRAPYASRWKTVRPTEETYQLADEYYRYAARRDLGLPPARDVTLPRLCILAVTIRKRGRAGLFDFSGPTIKPLVG